MIIFGGHGDCPEWGGLQGVLIFWNWTQNFWWTWRLPRVRWAPRGPLILELDAKSSSLKVHADWNHFWYETSGQWYLLRLCCPSRFTFSKDIGPPDLWFSWKFFLFDSVQICYGAWGRCVLLRFCSPPESTLSLISLLHNFRPEIERNWFRGLGTVRWC